MMKIKELEDGYEVEATLEDCFNVLEEFSDAEDKVAYMLGDNGRNTIRLLTAKDQLEKAMDRHLEKEETSSYMAAMLALIQHATDMDEARDQFMDIEITEVGTARRELIFKVLTLLKSNK